jgi:plastocyanin/methionine-rich copper-binding protein CopC
VNMKRQQGFSGLFIIFAIVIFAIIGTASWVVLREEKPKQPATNAVAPTPAPAPGATPQQFTFATPKKGAHFETSTPAHGTVLSSVPPTVVLDFNFDLASNSTIKIMKDGKDYGTGDTSVDAGKLGLRRAMDPSAPDGLYTVTYDGCWPDRTCHDGQFQFAIDRSLLTSYEDKRGQAEITVRMSEMKFKPANLRISKGTKITWVNDEAVEHYVNTDSHPAHTHEPGLNSRALAKGASFSYTFDKVGAYPYHCSAHAANMTGAIVVES